MKSELVASVIFVETNLIVSKNVIPEFKTLFVPEFVWALRLPPSFPITRIGTMFVTSILAGRRNRQELDKQPVFVAFGPKISTVKNIYFIIKV